MGSVPGDLLGHSLGRPGEVRDGIKTRIPLNVEVESEGACYCFGSVTSGKGQECPELPPAQFLVSGVQGITLKTRGLRLGGCGP